MARNGRADEALVAALAGGATAQAAAQLCDLSPRTVFRRLEDPSFRRRVSRARAEVLERALGHLSGGAADAAVVLRNLLGDDKVAAQTKLQAAKTVLELGAKLRENVELEARLAALEEGLAKKVKG